MNADWREFEMLVARLEKVLAPRGAVVTSPDHVIDKISGETREVDASIRPSPGALPVHVIECRDRSKVQDVTWIEQLVTKCQDHGIKTTAVSAKGFTKTVALKAQHYSIETRETSKISQDEMLGWIKISNIEHLILKPAVAGIFITVAALGREAQEQLKFGPAITEQMNREGGKAHIFADKKTGVLRSACEFLDIAKAQNPSGFFGTEMKAGEKKTRVMNLTFARDLYSIETAPGPRDLLGLRLTVEITAELVVSPVPALGHLYAGSERDSVQGIESVVPMLGAEIRTSFNKKSGSDTLFIDVTIEPSRANGSSPPSSN